MSTKQAFLEICKTAQPAKKSYVSLYVDLPYYGGPEEGGWWGSDTELVAYQETNSDVEAKELQDQVRALAIDLSRDAKGTFNRRCAAETEWLEARGLDDSFLPEVDGPSHYWVTTEQRPGEHVNQGSRHYE